MLPSSLLIRDMPQLISPVESRHEHEGVKRVLGLKEFQVIFWVQSPFQRRLRLWIDLGSSDYYCITP
jgi:hypothetical protein